MDSEPRKIYGLRVKREKRSENRDRWLLLFSIADENGGAIRQVSFETFRADLRKFRDRLDRELRATHKA